MGRGFCQKQETASEQVARLIKGYQVMRGYTRKTLAQKARINESTLTGHINDPEKMRVAEMFALANTLNIPGEEFLKILGGK